MKKIPFLLLGALLAAGAGSAAAQTTQNASATITVPTILSLSVANTAVTFGTPAAADFDAGFIGATTTSAVTHKGNVTHSVQIEANSATMTASGGAGSGSDAARSDKPASDLQWSTGAGWTALSTTAANVHQAAARGSYADHETVQYRMRLDYGSDTPGTYTLAFRYTVVAN